MGTKYDAQYAIKKKFKHMGTNLNMYFKDDFLCDTFGHKYDMANKYTAVVKPHQTDVFDIERGKREAKEKVMRNYYAALDRRLQLFAKNIITEFFYNI